MAAEKGYDAFISYSHLHDGALAPRLQAKLERFAKPWYRMRALRVFCDTANLAANPELWTSIQNALSTSRWLVLLASAEAAKSDYVNREVCWWLEHRSADHMLVAGTSPGLAWDEQRGDWAVTAPVPPVLRGRPGSEPRWVDMSDLGPGDGREPQIPADGVAELAAPLRGMEKDQLIGEHLKYRRRTLFTVVAAVAALAVLTVVALRFAGDTSHQRVLAFSAALATQSEQLEVTDPATAALLAAAAWQAWPTAQAREAMLDSLAQPERAVVPGGSLAGSAMAFSPDGMIVAYTGSSGQFRLANLATGRQMDNHLKIKNNANPVAVSPDGKTLVIETFDGLIQRWDVATGRQEGASLSVFTSYTWTTYAPGNKLLTCVYTGNTLQIWDVTAGRKLETLPLPVPGRDTIVAVSPDLQMMAQMTDSGAVYEENIATGRTQKTPLDLHGFANMMALSPGGKLLATADPNGVITLWNMATGQQEGAPLTVPGGLYGMTFSPDGSALATDGHDGTIRLWNVDLYRQVGSPLTLPQGLSGEAFSPGGATIATWTPGGIGLWNLASHRISGDLTAPGWSEPAIRLVAFSPDGKIVAGSYGNGMIGLWDAATRRLNGRPLAAGDVSAIAFDPASQILATAALDNGPIRLWNVATQQQIAGPLTVHGQVLAMTFSPDGKTLFAAGGSETDSGTWAGTWQISSHQQIGTPFQLPPFVSAVFGPGGSILATASEDGTVRLWDTADRSELGTAFTTGSEYVTAMAFSPDGGILATANSNSMVELWDTSTDHQIGASMTPYIEDITMLAFSPDGNTLATGGGSVQVSTGPGGNGTIWLWDVASPKDLLRAVCGLAGHPFTQQEWDTYAPSEPYQKTCPD